MDEVPEWVPDGYIYGVIAYTLEAEAHRPNIGWVDVIWEYLELKGLQPPTSTLAPGTPTC